MPEEFDEALYLQANPDVAAAVAAGKVPSGRHHYERHGQYEGRALRPRLRAYVFYIDVFSYCNLRCPSCVVGNKYGGVSDLPRGLMSPRLLERIVGKASRECAVTAFALYNWTEPLLHPQIADLVRIVKAAGVPCWLSSNLNILREPEILLAAGPDRLRVSLSGFTQDVYRIGHRAGDIEIVKTNMRRLADAHASVNSSTAIEVFFHRYVYNGHEVAEMAEFSRSLGFAFDSTFAYITPVEKIVEISEGRTNDDDAALLANLIVPLDQALAITSRVRKQSCPLLEDVVALDVEGNAMLCCGSSMAPANRIGNFLGLSLEEIQQRRRRMALCGPCLNLGIPDYFAGSPEFAEIARA